MRILHVLDHSLPVHSGYAFRTAAILREQRAIGFETLQLTTPRQNSHGAGIEDVAGLRFHRTPMTAGLLSTVPGGLYVDEMRATARRLDGVTAEFAPDVLHAHSPVLNALPTLWVGRRRRLPVVYELRALWEDAATDHGTTREGSSRYRASRALETFALRRADHVTTICEGLRAEVIARGIAADRVTVVPNAVDTRQFAFGLSADPALRAHLGLDGKRVIGFAGSFYGYEGLDLLIGAAVMLMPRRPLLRVLLIGGGLQENALKRQAAASGFGDRIIFAGRVEHEAVQRYYELIDVLAYPRKRMRLTDLVTPLKPLEAMAQGRIVVASDVGGHRELVRHGETGFLCQADDPGALAQALASALDDERAWPDIRARARHYVEVERTWSNSVRRYRDVYARVAGNARSALPSRAWR